MNTLLQGRAGEACAAEYLRKKGWEIIAASYRSRFGEIDLIARRRGTVAFVEVKLRRSDAFAAACEAVDARKQERLRRTAACWLAESGGDWDCRFDVIEVYTGSGRINHIENAFQ